MNIEEKFALSEDFGTIYFFTDGIFAQMFSASLYLMTQHRGLQVKICGYRYKKLGNALVLRGGLPIKTLLAKYPDQLIKRDYGFDMPFHATTNCQAEYMEWSDIQKAQLLTVEQETGSLSGKTANITASKMTMTLPLDMQRASTVPSTTVTTTEGTDITTDHTSTITTDLNSAATTPIHSVSTHSTGHPTNLPSDGNIPLSTLRQLILTEQEYQFLQQWQLNHYPSSIESGFIWGLQQKLKS